jgi:hypothetical protein
MAHVRADVLRHRSDTGASAPATASHGCLSLILPDVLRKLPIDTTALKQPA